jgi:predicted GH43/DUF377 family glycosyl hydrolase
MRCQCWPDQHLELWIGQPTSTTTFEVNSDRSGICASHLIFSDDLYTWNGGLSFIQPAYPWEFVQIGNCGSPIELDEGWLVLTHGVGPVRKYSIGAVLLDKKDPAKVLARAREPLVRPKPTERAGYVPNVVYTCGAMRHGERIILPYAISDTFSSFATIKIAALLEALAG